VVLGSECPYCGNDRGDGYYCAHCSAAKDFIAKPSIGLPRPVDLNEIPVMKLEVEKIVAEKLMEKEAENIIEQTVTAMDAVQETFAEYKKPFIEYKKPVKKSRGRRRQNTAMLPAQAFIGMFIIALVMMVMLNPNMLPYAIEGGPSEDIKYPLLHVDVYVTIYNFTADSVYTGFAHFVDEEGDSWCTFGSGTKEQGYDLFALFCAGERILLCINVLDNIEGDYPYSFRIPADWTKAEGVCYITLPIN